MRQRLVLLSGTILFLLGVVRFLLAPGRWGVNSATQLPTIVSGAEFMILGAGLLVIWFWTRKHKEKLVKMELDEIEEKKNKRKAAYKWGRGFK